MNGNDKVENKNPLYKNKKIIIPAIILIGAIAGFWFWYQGQLGHVSTDDAFVDADKATISAKILGRIDSLTVDEGDTVKSGDLIAQLSSSDILAQIKEAEAQLNLAKDNVKLAEVKLDKATDDFNRAELQYKNNVIPKEQYDHAQKEVQAEQVQLNISQSRVSTAQARINVLNTNLENTKIISPLDGIVAKRWVLQGDVVQPGQPIFSVYKTSNLWVTANFEETKISSIGLGDSVNISVDAFPDNKFKGTVIQIGTNTASQFSLIPPNNASGNFTKVTQRVPVKISIEQVQTQGDRKITLLPGLSVEVDIKERN